MPKKQLVGMTGFEPVNSRVKTCCVDRFTTSHYVGYKTPKHHRLPILWPLPHCQAVAFISC